MNNPHPHYPWDNPWDNPPGSPHYPGIKPKPWIPATAFEPSARPALRAVDEHPLFKRLVDRMTAAPKDRRKVAGPKRTHMIFVLDRSRSMLQGRDITIAGFNDQVNTVREGHEGAGETTVSLVLFSDRVSTSYAFANPSRLECLTEKTYQPDGWTALYDGVGQAIELILCADGFDKTNTAFFVGIFTDGEENKSHYCNGPLIAKCIALLEATGRVTFSLMGPKEGLSSISDVLSINPGNIAGYDASTRAGRAQAFACMNNATASYLAIRSAGFTATTSLYRPDPRSASD